MSIQMNISLKSGIKLSKRMFENIKRNFSTGRSYHIYDLGSYFKIKV